MKKPPTKGKLKDILHIAQLAAMEAGDYAQRQFTRAHVLKEKPMSTDEVTSVDIECEKRIVKILKKNFPHHTVFTEERKLPKKRKEYLWWVDPLDGSISYFFGLPYWGISLALIYQGEPIVGVVYFPQTRDLYWAIKKSGAFCNYRKISVSDAHKLKDGVIGIDYGYRTEREEGVENVTLKLIDKVKYAVTYACTVGALMLVAEGKLSGYVHHMGRLFDHAAGVLIVTEAGGKASDIKGNPIDWQKTEPVHIVASNGNIHKELIHTLKASKSGVKV